MAYVSQAIFYSPSPLGYGFGTVVRIRFLHIKSLPQREDLERFSFNKKANLIASD